MNDSFADWNMIGCVSHLLALIRPTMLRLPTESEPHAENKDNTLIWVMSGGEDFQQTVPRGKFLPSKIDPLRDYLGSIADCEH